MTSAEEAITEEEFEGEVDSSGDDKILDFIDGTVRKKTPEEYVRQNVERSLVQEYRYTREEIAVEFKVKVGSAKKRVDLAIFREDASRTQENIIILSECKREGVSSVDKREGIEQLKSYMAACPNCTFGVWTNGSDERLCFRREDVDGGVSFAEVVDIPSKGEPWRDADVPNRLKLRPSAGDNLLLAFKRCHNYIAGNQGLQKPEAFWELLKVIFCKIEDERSLGSISFYISNREQRNPDGQLKCKRRLDGLFATVRAKHSSIFKSNEEIELNRAVLGYIVAQLQGYSLLESPVDVKGVAYEEVVGSNLRGDRGEFFTPRNACKMAVELLSPEPGDRIIDPACGTGGFLVTAMNLVLARFDIAARKRWRKPDSPSSAEMAELYRGRQEMMASTVVGLDINPNLVRAAKMNMVMNNDGSGGLFQADALRDLVTWSEEARKKVALGSFDYVFTNPPFGAGIRIDNPEVLGQYDLAALWDWDETSKLWKKRIGTDGQPTLQAALPPEILFIERAIQFLRPGKGRMAMVIPNGILNNPPLGYVRQWMLNNTQVLAVVDMQRDLFQPRNDTQTSMVFLRRKSEEEKGVAKNYPIFMAVADKIGHDKRGRPIYRRSPDGGDIFEMHKITVKVVEEGEVVEKLIEEKGRIVDDQLPEIPGLYRQWAEEHGL